MKGVGEHVTKRRSLGRVEKIPFVQHENSRNAFQSEFMKRIFHGLNLLQQSGL